MFVIRTHTHTHYKSHQTLSCTKNETMEKSVSSQNQREKCGFNYKWKNNSNKIRWIETITSYHKQQNNKQIIKNISIDYKIYSPNIYENRVIKNEQLKWNHRQIWSKSWKCFVIFKKSINLTSQSRWIYRIFRCNCLPFCILHWCEDSMCSLNWSSYTAIVFSPVGFF